MAQTQVERAQEMVRELLTTGQDVLAHVSKEDLADLVRHLKGSQETIIKHLKRVLEGRKGKLISPEEEKTKGADDEH